MALPVVSILIALLVHTNARNLNDIESEILERSSTYEFDEMDEQRAAEMLRGFNLIYPGTKWCGMGNSAENYDDLGDERETDICCRAHDHCPDLIPAFGTRHNLTNNMIYTRLSCECDETFHQCLKSANTSSANNVGNIYFNVLLTRCFREDYPVTGCRRRGGILRTKCAEYTYDVTEDKLYQWFDVPDYPSESTR